MLPFLYSGPACVGGWIGFLTALVVLLQEAGIALNFYILTLIPKKGL
jgi:hypothetical protein